MEHTLNRLDKANALTFAAESLLELLKSKSISKEKFERAREKYFAATFAVYGLDEVAPWMQSEWEQRRWILYSDFSHLRETAKEFEAALRAWNVDTDFEILERFLREPESPSRRHGLADFAKRALKEARESKEAIPTVSDSLGPGDWLSPPISLRAMGRRFNPPQSSVKLKSMLRNNRLQQYPRDTPQSWTVDLTGLAASIRRQLTTPGESEIQ